MSPHPATTCFYTKSLPSFSVGPLQVLEGHCKVSLEPSLFQAEQPQLSQSVLIGEVLQPSDHPCSSSSSSSSLSFLCWGFRIGCSFFSAMFCLLLSCNMPLCVPFPPWTLRMLTKWFSEFIWISSLYRVEETSTSSSFLSSLIWMQLPPGWNESL